VNPAVIVTGANGFIGTGLMSKLGPLRATALSVRETDWAKRAGALRFEDATLVHLGGRAHQAGVDAAAVHQDNCVKTLALAEFAQSRGLKRFVFVSSVKVHGESSRARPLVESDVPAPADAYGRAKRDAEAGLARIARATGLELVVLRPPLVYGPGVRGNFLSLLQLASRRWPLPFALLRNRRSLVNRDNLVSAIEACIVHPRAAGRTFLVAGGPPVSTAQLVTAIRSAMKRPAGLFAFPATGLRALAWLAGRAGEARRLTESLEIDDSLLRSTLDWQPAQGFEDAIGETVRWFLSTRAARA
jgi:nucleoside-diphosphate-sugar epimerase